MRNLIGQFELHGHSTSNIISKLCCAIPAVYHLKCGDKALVVREFSNCYILMNGRKTASSSFRVEQTTPEKNKFEISYVNESPTADQSIRTYLATNDSHPNDPSGVLTLQIGQGVSVACTLEDSSGRKIGADIERWLKEPCHVRVVSPTSGYLGYNKVAEVVVLVADQIKAESDSSLLLDFQLELSNPEIDETGNVVMREQKHDDPQPDPRPNINKPGSQSHSK